MRASKTINSISHASNILLCLSDGMNRLVDISNKLHLSKGTTHRLLKALEATGFVLQDAISKRYYLGGLVLKLGSNPAIAHQNLVASALQEMEYLREISGETVGLHVQTGSQWLVLEELPSLQQIRFAAGKGYTSFMHTSSAGRVLLSELKENELNKFLRSGPLYRIGPNTITDKNKLLDEIKKIRKQGYATGLSELNPGGAAISVPIKNYTSPAAIGIVGIKDRFLSKRKSFLKELKKSAKNISNRLQKYLID